MHLINDAVKPWDDLNRLLAKPFAYNPEYSDITRLAKGIAVAIKHMAEASGVGRRVADKESFENCVISDVADAWKHGSKKLKDPTRQNEMHVSSRFEFNQKNEMRFVRNRVVIEHVTHGSVDFMVSSRNALRYWLRKTNAQLSWSGAILEGPLLFLSHATVYYDPAQQLDMSSIRLETVQRGSNGVLHLTDCPQITLVVVDFNQTSFKSLPEPILGQD